MDYTKDAVLIEAMKSLEDIGTTSSPHGNYENSYVNSGNLHHHHSHHHHSQQFGTFSTMALLNTSEYIERNVKMGGQTNLAPVLLMKANGSLSSPDYPSASLPPISEGSQYDDMFNDTMDYIPMSMRPETYIVPVLFAIIFIIGVIGNGTLIVIFIKHRSMRNVPNM